MGAIFETERLIPLEWTLDDAEAAFAISGDPNVTRFLGGECRVAPGDVVHPSFISGA